MHGSAGEVPEASAQNHPISRSRPTPSPSGAVPGDGLLETTVVRERTLREDVAEEEEEQRHHRSETKLRQPNVGRGSALAPRMWR